MYDSNMDFSTIYFTLNNSIRLHMCTQMINEVENEE